MGRFNPLGTKYYCSSKGFITPILFSDLRLSSVVSYTLFHDRTNNLSGTRFFLQQKIFVTLIVFGESQKDHFHPCFCIVFSMILYICISLSPMAYNSVKIKCWWRQKIFVTQIISYKSQKDQFHLII